MVLRILKILSLRFKCSMIMRLLPISLLISLSSLGRGLFLDFLLGVIKPLCSSPR